VKAPRSLELVDLARGKAARIAADKSKSRWLRATESNLRLSQVGKPLTRACG
jgi:hypothetical protein